MIELDDHIGLPNPYELSIQVIDSRIKDKNSFLNALKELGFRLCKSKNLKNYFDLYVFKKDFDLSEENAKKFDKKTELKLKEKVNKSTKYDKLKNTKNNNTTVNKEKLNKKYKSVLSPCLYKKR